jgi:HSF-type DNA-binding
MTKKSSFLRQLNLYSFNRFSAGPDQGSYYHEKFLRGMKFLCRRMSRQKVNGNRIRSAGNPDEEPNLVLFPVCPPPGLAAADPPGTVATKPTAQDNAAVLSALAGIAAVASSLPTQKLISEQMTAGTPAKGAASDKMEEEDDDDDDDDEEEDYGSSEENYSTGNSLRVNSMN